MQGSYAREACRASYYRRHAGPVIRIYVRRHAGPVMEIDAYHKIKERKRKFAPYKIQGFTTPREIVRQTARRADSVSNSQQRRRRKAERNKIEVQSAPAIPIGNRHGQNRAHDRALDRDQDRDHAHNRSLNRGRDRDRFRDKTPDLNLRRESQPVIDKEGMDVDGENPQVQGNKGHGFGNPSRRNDDRQDLQDGRTETLSTEEKLLLNRLNELEKENALLRLERENQSRPRSGNLNNQRGGSV
ncbi:DEAD-box ATP-dependent RNA helicase 21-like [Papaver somniferum]|uniref:DEAD-box ATP-dependent RNA helicase 21-like n=1 Tax=Papaver somniferum TaxID=3469 RepID=UPI000E6F5EB7|nr:DEAD-box ATP-dependent RNA helicase 21-like [Papaver somniferum]